MGEVDRCLEDDVPAVADLHNRVFFRTTEPSSAGLRTYYRDMFFRNPWVEEKLPSLVYRANGKIMGFLGCVTRPMEVEGRPIRVAVLHRLMVAPDVDSPLAAMRLVQEVLAGPQDLTLADGTNDSGRTILEWCGASMAHAYSLNWWRALRPTAFALEMLVKKHTPTSLAGAARPAAKLIDAVLCSANASPFRIARPATKEVAIRGDLVLRGLEEFSRSHSLRPTYDLRSLEWLLDALARNKHRGQFDGIGILSPDDTFIGLSLFYTNTARVVEVMLLAARDDSRDAVLRHLIYSTSRRGGIALTGRLEPRFLRSFADHHCLMKCRDWAFVHAKDPELMRIVDRGDAFISSLEGELWLRSPMDRL